MTLPRPILTALRQTSPHGLRDTTLRTQVSFEQDCTLTEIRTALEDMEAKGWVANTRSPIDGNVSWYITEAGKAALLTS